MQGVYDSVYDSVVLKDVIGRYRVSDTMMIESILRFAFDIIGSQLSTKSISDVMNTNSRKIDVKNVERYLYALIDSYILNQARRYDIKGKQHSKTLKKYYTVDLGLRHLLLGRSGTDIGHMLENVIYLELKRRGFQVYIGKIDTREVDFVAKDQEGTTYYQVAASVRDRTTLERELRPVQNISDNYPKIILTLDEDPKAEYEGI